MLFFQNSFCLFEKMLLNENETFSEEDCPQATPSKLQRAGHWSNSLLSCQLFHSLAGNFFLSKLVCVSLSLSLSLFPNVLLILPSSFFFTIFLFILHLTSYPNNFTLIFEPLLYFQHLYSLFCNEDLCNLNFFSF